MSDLVKRKFKCTGCGEARPCYLETNQEKNEIEFFDAAEYLTCVLDENNHTSYNWTEVQANEAETSQEIALHKHGVSNNEAKESGEGKVAVCECCDSETDEIFEICQSCYDVLML